MDLAMMLRLARRRAGLTQRELATRAGTSHPTIAAYEAGTKVPRADTLVRLLAATRTAVVTEHQPYEGTRAERDDELVQVLLLAEQFPARLSRRLAAPRFGAAIRAAS